MRNVLLIAVSFVREQRWPIFVLLLWVVGLCLIGLTIDLRKSREDVLIIFKQLAVYGVAFAVFFGGSASIMTDARGGSWRYSQKRSDESNIFAGC